MSQIQQKVELIQSEVIAAGTVRLTLNAPDIAAAAVPGQFVMVQTAQGLDPLLRRPFSIHQINSEGLLQILFKVVGRGTERLAQCRTGEQLSILGPLGNGFNLGESGNACLVGGGMGIAPLLFLASRFLQQSHGGVTPRVILGARNREELVPLMGDFLALGIEVLAATDDGSFGYHGLVTDVLKTLNLTSQSSVYSCGPKPMMAAVHHLCQKENIPCQVSVETVMACGMGACLGCAVPLKAGGYAHVCSDGPVFEAGELLWSL
ncbi:MAG: dihydroorotate dehydrogenase electron transfer subunit [Proteobacteria bacterium]|nr:dihydroorotate dehydrogenase electron transfer subunit [Desulfocapsa sp.]MBU3946484.1 dihydroorotate dehydrogenase electron transfer subunit [Pseudomonadota bacterium]MCG2743029.1 dihydroorotate dehydrogenase electron transfer subunit [Desulfobacteraceae bacterium]MBU4028328.1 dihydroorotate dehydrogenase electron transfer subunit [Pseudomonadota bacterium]MBU4044152.1 dihydroorotate dehydrogenase electron transfer subunit [Pseudomonadota bacterium]